MNPRIRQFLHEEWLQVAVVLIPLIAALTAMPFATEHVPMQWNLSGQVNWYAPKEWGLLAVPVTMLLVFGFVLLMEARDKNRRRPEDGALTSHGKATRTIRLAVSLLLMGVCLVQIASALGRHVDMMRLVPAGCALLIAFIGNLFGKLKPNRYAGIRVPWTLRSETVWRKTHRAAGWLWSVSGLIVAVLCLLLPPSRYEVAIGSAWIVVLGVVPLIVAWRAARAEGPVAVEAVPGGRWNFWLGVLVLLGLGAFYGWQAGVNLMHSPERKAAQAAAERWIIPLDEGRYADAWETTGNAFRKAAPQPAVIAAWNKYRKPAGAKVSRGLREASFTESLPGAPPGRYVVVRFDTVFEHQPDAIETVVEELEKDGQWKVSGYFIK